MATTQEKNNTYPFIGRRAFLPFLFLAVFPFGLTEHAACFAEEAAVPRIRFALVLSGGGARGLSQIGVLKALDDAGLKPDLIVGTSMGAIIGSLYAAGYAPDSILDIVRAIEWDDIFTNKAKRSRLFVSQKSEPVNFLFEVRLDDRLELIPPSSISHGQIFFDHLAPLLASAQFRAGMNFDSLPVPLRIVTTDLLSGKKVVLSRGNIAAAVRASCGVPLAFSPVVKDSMLLMDGGLVSNIPADIARDEHSGLIVAVDVTSPLWKRNELENPVRLMDQVVSIGIRHQKESDKKKADFVIVPALDGFSNTDFRPVDTLVSLGYERTRLLIDTLSFLLGPLEPLKTRIMAAADPGTIRGIVISGNHKTSPRLIGIASGLKEGAVLSPAAIQKAVTSLYATGLFNNVNVDMDTARNVRMMVEEKKYWRIRMGLRYDEFNRGEGFVQPAYENIFGSGVCALLHLQYGLRREKYAFELHVNQFLSANFSNSAKIQTYLSTERIFQDTTVITPVGASFDTTLWHKEKTLRKGGVLGLAGIQLGRTTMLSSGIHLELYKVQSTDITAFSDLWGLKFLPYALFRLTMDDMDKFPFPTSGMKNFISVGGTSRSIGANKNFLKFDLGGRMAATFFKKHTFSPQIRFAWASSPLPEVEQLYLGGSFPEETHQDMEISNYVPFYGLSPRALRGDVLGVGRLAYSFSLKKALYLTAGVDWGYTWNRRNLSWEKSAEEFIRYAPVGFGIGFAFGTIAGPVRCSYGRLLHDFNRKAIPADNKLYFSIGHDF